MKSMSLIPTSTMTLMACLIRENEEWEWIFHFFSPSFPCLDKLNDEMNKIKRNFNRNETPPIIGNSILSNYEVF